MTMTVDPSFAGVALVLAPLNALVYGAVGLVIGVVVTGIMAEITRSND